ncbi:MAG: hypothetical protein AB1330_01185 [Bacillota bacterium]
MSGVAIESLPSKEVMVELRLESLPSVEIAVKVEDERTYTCTITSDGVREVLVGNFLPCPVVIEAPQGAVSEAISVSVTYKGGVLRSFTETSSLAVSDASSDAYYWPRVTDVVFEISGDGELLQPVTVSYELGDILTPSQLSRAEVRKLVDGVWYKVTSSLSGSVLSFEVSDYGTYAVFINEFAYSRFSQYMAALLPSWMKIRTDSLSVGQQFLNHFGLEFEVLQDYLDWCLNNQFIGTVNLGQIDIIYKAPLPFGITPNHTVIVSDDNQPIELTDSVEEFYRANGHVAIIDYEQRYVYTRYFYSNGLDFSASDGTEIIEAKNIPLVPHHVWNALDEFGLLLGVARWPQERNAEFKERILDVFRYPANATRLGLYRAIARELGFIRRAVWEDDSQALVLCDENIIPETVLVDGVRVLCELGQDGSVTVPPQNTGAKRRVTYIAGFYLHTLHSPEKDDVLFNLLYAGDYEPTAYFRQLVERLHREIPFMWDEFRWDEGYWDVVNKDFLGLDFLPTLWDADVEIWRALDDD